MGVRSESVGNTVGSKEEAQKGANAVAVPNESDCDTIVDDEPSSHEHARTIAIAAATSGAAYGLCRLTLPSASAEDVVDIVHSLGTSSMAIYGAASMEPNAICVRSLPAHLSAGRGPIVRMFAGSLGYFLADAIKIAVDTLIRGKFPHLWQGRLAHHVIQLGANMPGIFCKGLPKDQNLAWRSVLCLAYLAEVSSIFLRLSNIVRQVGRPRLARAVNWGLVMSFFGCRIVNFWFAIAMYVKARGVLPARLFQLGLTVQAGGYLLSAAWFMKIVRIALKPMKPEILMPSVEC